MIGGLIGKVLGKAKVKKSYWGGYNSHTTITDIEDGFNHVDHVNKIIAERGLTADYEVVLPDANQLQIDYDCAELPKIFEEALGLLAQTVSSEEHIEYKVFRSRSGNLHVTVTCPYVFDAVSRIAWQAVFGSDIKREGLSLMYHSKGHLNPTLLIEKKNRQPIQTGVKCNRKAEAVGRRFRD
jgi:hypothetical protein